MTDKRKLKNENKKLKIEKRNAKTLANIARRDAKREERESKCVPGEVAKISILHPNRKKMSSEKCLEKHLECKERENKAKERALNSKIIIVKKDER